IGARRAAQPGLRRGRRRAAHRRASSARRRRRRRVGGDRRAGGLRTAHAPRAGSLRRRRPDRELPPLGADRLLERALTARSGRRAARRGVRSASVRAARANRRCDVGAARRGGWASLAIGVVVLVVVDPRRVQALWWLALLGVAAFVAVVVARWYSALSTNGAPLSAQTHAGHRTLLVLAVVSVLTGAGAFVWARVERNLPLDEPRVARRATLAVGVVVVLAAIAFFAVEGAPWSVAHRAWHSFASAPPAEGSNLSGRLFHLSGNGRVATWHAAWREASAHPLAGTGAGTFEHVWNLTRSSALVVQNVHNLYLEALATLGVVG